VVDSLVGGGVSRSKLRVVLDESEVCDLRRGVDRSEVEVGGNDADVE
jgi:hypothetical protein